MSWVRLALGLIREAATSEIGRDVIKDLRSSASRKKQQPAPGKPDDVAEWRRSVDERLSAADHNLELLVGMLNAQEQALIKIQKRQRIWNVVLGAAGLAAIVMGAIALVW